MLSELCKGLGAACLIGCSTLAWATTADEIKQKLENNEPGAAYELGRAHPELLGDASFDFYFGIAALNAGSPGEGVLALERYVARYPDNPAGRFHLGRGYFIIGEDLRAREELESLYQQAGEEERAVIQQYLDAIWVRESRYRPAATAYLEGGIGYDSNINGGIDSGPVAGLPGFEILPGTTQEKESDTQALWAAGVQGSLPVTPGWAVYGGVHVNGKLNLGDGNDLTSNRPRCRLAAAIRKAAICIAAGSNGSRSGSTHNAIWTSARWSAAGSSARISSNCSA